MFKKALSVTCGIGVVVALAGCSMSGANAGTAQCGCNGKTCSMRSGAGIKDAVCVLFQTGPGNMHEVCGTIHFTKLGNGKIHVTGQIRGLTPGKHGFHVHEFGDLTSMADGKSTGGHFNPHHEKHGRPSDADRHVGDLGNVVANASGVATVDITDSVISFGGENSIIGRGIVVHKGEDHFTQPTGDADGRYAVGVIGIAK